MSDRKRQWIVLGDGYYYKELLRFAEDLPTKTPPEESAVEDSQLAELMSALRAANLEDNDVPLFTLFREHGFGKVETYLLISLMARRKKRRGRPEKDSILKLQARALLDIKNQLRKGGVRAKIHERAIKILEEGHSLSCKAALSDWGLDFGPLDRETLENHIRRSSQPRKRSIKSRAK